MKLVSYICLKKVYLLYAMITIVYILVASVSSHIFDDATYVQHAQWFYYMDINPLYYWLPGSYYLSILLIGYFPVIIIGFIGIHSVLLEQFFIKFPLIIFLFLTASLSKKLFIQYSGNKPLGQIISLLILTNPLSFYVVAIHGNPMIIPVFFSLLSLYYLEMKRPIKAGFSMGIAIGTYVYPIFFIIPILYFLGKTSRFKKPLLFLFITSITSFVGIYLPYIVFLMEFGSLPSSGLITSAGNLASNQLPLYSVFGVLGLLGFSAAIPYSSYFWIFIFSMLTFAIVSVFVVRLKTDFIGLNTSFLIISLAFVVFDFSPTPQYFIAIVPFLVIYAAFRKKVWLLVLLYIVGGLLFLAVFTWGSGDLFGFFANTYPHLLKYEQSFPYEVYLLFSSLLGGLLLALLFGLTIYEMASPFICRNRNGTRKKTIHTSDEIFTHVSKYTVKFQILAMILVLLLGLVAVAPSLSNPPKNMVLLSNINTFDLSCSIEKDYKENAVIFEYNTPYLVKLMPKYVLDNTNVTLSYNNSIQTIYSLFALNDTVSVTPNSNLSFQFILPFETTNLTFTFMSTDLTFANGNFSLISLQNNSSSEKLKYGELSYYIFNEYLSLGAAYVNVSFQGLLSPGEYKIIDKSTGMNMVLSTFTGTEVRGFNTCLNKAILHNEYISTVVRGTPLLFYNASIGGTHISSLNNMVSIPLSILLSSNNIVVIKAIDINVSNDIPAIQAMFSLANLNFHSFVVFNMPELLLGGVGFILFSISSFVSLRRLLKF